MAVLVLLKEYDAAAAAAEEEEKAFEFAEEFLLLRHPKSSLGTPALTPLSSRPGCRNRRLDVKHSSITA